MLREVDTELNFRRYTWIEFFHTYNLYKEELLAKQAK